MYTVRPFRSRQIGKLSFGHDADARPHSVMTDTTKLVAGHPIVARRIEAGADFGDEAGDYHRIDVGPDKQEPMNDVGAGHTKLDGGVGRHPHTFGDKVILLGD